MTSKPREINPECLDDDAFWDLEALKLAVISPHKYSRYASGRIDIDGSGGLFMLRFLTTMYYMNGSLGSFDSARITNFGESLINACKRLNKVSA